MTAAGDASRRCLILISGPFEGSAMCKPEVRTRTDVILQLRSAFTADYFINSSKNASCEGWRRDGSHDRPL